LLLTEISMRKVLFAAVLALPLGVLAADPQTVVLDVQNMTCELCPITVKKALHKVPGVASTKIDLAKKTATVKFDPEQPNVAALGPGTRGFLARRFEALARERLVGESALPVSRPATMTFVSMTGAENLIDGGRRASRPPRVARPLLR